MLKNTVGFFLLALTAQTVAQTQPSCFPESASVSANRRDWYCGQLAAAGEGRLVQDPGYRFLYLPSFHPARVVSAFWKEGRYYLSAKVLTGVGGSNPGVIGRTVERELTSDEWRRLEDKLQAAGIWAPQAAALPEGMDGSRWILEGRATGRYAMHDLWTPFEREQTAYREACVYLLDLAGIRPAAADLY